MGDLTRNVQVIFPMLLLNKERPLVLTKGCSEHLTIWYIKGKQAYYTHVQRYHHLITRLWFDSRKKKHAKCNAACILQKEIFRQSTAEICVPPIAEKRLHCVSYEKDTLHNNYLHYFKTPLITFCCAESNLQKHNIPNKRLDAEVQQYVQETR